MPVRSLVLAAALLAVTPVAAGAASKTQTLRFYDKPVAYTLTKADGTVLRKQPLPEPASGDVLQVDSVDYPGTFAKHAKRWTASTHLTCTFVAVGPPSCDSIVALGGSLLFFSGNPGKLTHGTGIYQGATGRVVSSQEVGDDNASNIVAKIKLAAPPA